MGKYRGHDPSRVTIDFLAPDAVPRCYLTLNEAFERLHYCLHGEPSPFQGGPSTMADGSGQDSDAAEDWAALMELCRRFLACEKILKASFTSGQLTAEARDPASGDWLRIPPSYWSQNFFPPRPFACRPLNVPPRSLLGRYHGRTLLIRESRFANWLKGRERIHCSPEEASTPTTRVQRTESIVTQARRRGRPPKYNWSQFIDKALRLLTVMGLPREDSGRDHWRCKADFEKRMSDWCLSTWGREPAPSTIRQWVTVALVRSGLK